MLFSRPMRYIALGSCVAHILALGLAAAVQLTVAQPPVSFLKVALRFQQAVPLPVGNPGDPGVGAPPPAPEPTPAVTPPPPKPTPKTKPRSPRPTTAVSKPKPQPRPQPTVIATTSPTETPPLPALPSEIVGSGIEASGGKGAGGSGGKAGTGVGGGSGSGGGGGTSAHPDYGVNPKPPYPMLARRMGIQGMVVLRVHVRADGSVAEATLAQSSGSQLLDDSALKTVREQWRFLPARLDGTPVESWVEVPIRFVLDVS
jgi:protein TonB